MLIVPSIYSFSIDCQDVINLAYGAQMDIAQPLMMTKILTNCCDLVETKVTCTNSRVTEIDWGWLNLVGQINMTAVPSQVVKLVLLNNLLNSTINFLPNGIRILDLGLNKLSSTTLDFPESYEIINIQQNRINTSIAGFPSKLQSINAGYNYISGNIPRILPQSLIFLDVVYNLITGTIPTLSPNITHLRLGDNMITGNIPFLPSMLIDLHLDNLLISGCLPLIPDTVLSLIIGGKVGGSLKVFKPKLLIVKNNLITEFEMRNSSLMEFCDLSNNPLLGKVNQYNCQKNNLYRNDSLVCLNEIEALTLTHLQTTLYTTFQTSLFTTQPSTNDMIQTTQQFTVDHTVQTTIYTAIQPLQTTIDSALQPSMQMNQTMVYTSATKPLSGTPTRYNSMIRSSQSTKAIFRSTRMTSKLQKTAIVETKTDIAIGSNDDFLFNTTKLNLNFFGILKLIINACILVLTLNEVRHLNRKRPTKRVSMSIDLTS